MKNIYIQIRYYDNIPWEIKVDWWKCKCYYYDNIYSVIGFLVSTYLNEHNVHSIRWQKTKPLNIKTIYDVNVNTPYEPIRKGLIQ